MTGTNIASSFPGTNGSFGAAAGQSAGEALKNLGSDLKDGASTVADTVTGVAKHPVDSAKKAGSGFVSGVKNFFGPTEDGGLNVGGLLGGLLGILGSWFVSTMFGGGMMSTIAMVLLIPMGFLLGRKFGDENLNSMFGRNGSAAAQAQGQEHHKGQGLGLVSQPPPPFMATAQEQSQRFGRPIPGMLPPDYAQPAMLGNLTPMPGMPQPRSLGPNLGAPSDYRG